MLAAMDSCLGLFRPHQHGTASKQAQVPKKKKKMVKAQCLTKVPNIVASSELLMLSTVLS